MKLAAQVSREHRVPVVPVFWIDAEDHDWPEVSGCTVLDSEFAPSHGAARRSARRRLPADRPPDARPTPSTPPSTNSTAALPDSEFKTTS